MHAYYHMFMVDENSYTAELFVCLDLSDFLTEYEISVDESSSRWDKAIVSQTERPTQPRLGVGFASGGHPAPNLDGVLDARGDGGKRRPHEGGRRPQRRSDQGRRRREGEGVRVLIPPMPLAWRLSSFFFFRIE